VLKFRKLFYGNPGKSLSGLLTSEKLEDLTGSSLIVTNKLIKVMDNGIEVRNYEWLEENYATVEFEQLIVSTRMDLLNAEDRSSRYTLLRSLLQGRTEVVFFLSSIAVFGHNCSLIDSTTKIKPKTSYGAEKKQLEKFLCENQGTNSLVILRLSNVINFKDSSSIPSRILNHLLEKNPKNKLILGESRDFIYHEDVTEAMNKINKRVKEKSFTNRRVIVLGSGKSISLPRLVNSFCSHLGYGEDRTTGISYSHEIPQVAIKMDDWQREHSVSFRQFSEEEIVKATLKHVEFPYV